MKNILLILFLVTLSSCKENVENKTNTSEETGIIEEEEAIVNYPKLEQAPKEFNYIFENGFEFTENIKVNYIALHSKGDDNYQFIYGLDLSSDLEDIETLRISAVFYAENPKLFKEKLYQDRKSRQIAAVCKIMMLDNEPVISQEFKVLPKKFKQVKFYFYSNAGVENDKMLTVRNINMPQ